MSDNDIIQKAAAQMNRVALDIDKHTQEVADAKTVKEFHGDRLKKALSVMVAEALDAGKSATAAEHYARASKTYDGMLNDLRDQYRDAMRIIEKAEARKTMFESARSILSVEKQKMLL